MTYPPYGAQQFGPPQQPAQAPPGAASKAMGITAVVIAILAALVALAGAGWTGFDVIRGIADNNPMTRVIPLHAVAGGLLAVGALLLLTGAVLHAKRKKSGCVVLALGVVAFIASMAMGLFEEDAVDSPAGLVAGVIGVLAVILAVRSRLWLLPKQPAYPPSVGHHYGHQGYAQHPQQWR